MIEFLKNIIKANTHESSKRFIAVYSMILVTYIVVRFTTNENYLSVLEALLLFITIILGVAVYQAVKAKENAQFERKSNENENRL